MRLFAWLSASELPARFDLRRQGWWLEPRGGGPVGAFDDVMPAGTRASVGIAHLASMEGRSREALLALAPRPGVQAAARARVLLLGVRAAQERARLLQLGFGDALCGTPSLAELDLRAGRVLHSAEALPRWRAVGALRLDLLTRDAEVSGRPLGLHPREFALLWRLAETPGLAVGKAALLGDVWRLPYVPETNSLAVHVSRLRAKLALAGLAGVVRTEPSGGYRLVMQPAAGSA